MDISQKEITIFEYKDFKIPLLMDVNNTKIIRGYFKLLNSGGDLREYKFNAYENRHPKYDGVSYNSWIKHSQVGVLFGQIDNMVVTINSKSNS